MRTTFNGRGPRQLILKFAASRIQPLHKAFLYYSPSRQSYVKQSHLEHGGVLEVGLVALDGALASDLRDGVGPVVGLLVLPRLADGLQDEVVLGHVLRPPRLPLVDVRRADDLAVGGPWRSLRK